MFQPAQQRHRLSIGVIDRVGRVRDGSPAREFYTHGKHTDWRKPSYVRGNIDSSGEPLFPLRRIWREAGIRTTVLSEERGMGRTRLRQHIIELLRLAIPVIVARAGLMVMSAV